MTTADREHLERVRNRFTRTAQSFARFSLATRGDEAERLVLLAAPRGDEVALDLACGPGTFTRAFAARVRFLYALDLTPAMLEQARKTLAQSGLGKIAFTCGDANALPFADSVLGLAVCAYSFHHFLEPTRPVRELGRVVRRGGRVAIADIVVPEEADPEWTNRIERARDSSHARTLTLVELHDMLEATGLRVLASELGERLRQFDDWMQIMGSGSGTRAYAETRRLMEASIPGDTAGFHPRRNAQNEIEFVQTSAFVVAEKC